MQITMQMISRRMSQVFFFSCVSYLPLIAVLLSYRFWSFVIVTVTVPVGDCTKLVKDCQIYVKSLYINPNHIIVHFVLFFKLF